MSDQNPTEKGGAEETPVVMPKCPHCGKEVPGFNVSTMMLPTPNDQRGNITFLVSCCPFPECGKIINAQFIGHTPHEPGLGNRPSSLWRPH